MKDVGSRTAMHGWSRPPRQTALRQCLRRNRPGPYQVQAAINAVHADAPTAGATDWRQVLALYDQLLVLSPTPVVALNRAVALGMRDGPAAGLAAIEVLFGDGALTDYHLAHAARADLERRLGLLDAARASYARALELAEQPAERRFLQARLAELKR